MASTTVRSQSGERYIHSLLVERPTSVAATSSEDDTDIEDSGDEDNDIHRDVMARKRKQVKIQPWKQPVARNDEEKDGDTDTGGG